MQPLQKAIPILNKLFNIRTNEWPRLSLLYLMNFIYIASLTWAELILEAAFLQEIGVEALRGFFIAKAIVSIVVVALYSAFADRVANHKLLMAIFLGGAIPIIIGLFLIGQGAFIIAYPLLYLIVFVPFYDVQAAHWYTYVNGFYDTRSAKRIIPVLATSVSTAGIMAGFSMPLLNRFFTPTGIIMIWVVSLVIISIITWLMPYLLKEKKLERAKPLETIPAFSATKETAPVRTYLANTRDGYRYVLQSPFLRWMTISALLLALLLTFLQYQTSQIFLSELETAENISNFTGPLLSASNIVILLFQSLFLSRIMERMGLANANLIFPIGTLAMSSSLVLFRNLPAAAFSFINRSEFASLGYSINSLLYNAVPLRVKGRARAFITGIIVPLGWLAGGLFLLIPFANSTWFVLILIAVLALLYLGSELIVRKEYGHALINMLEQEDFSSLLSEEVTHLPVTDTNTLKALQKRLEESTNHEFTIFMAKLISQIGGRSAVPLLENITRQMKDARTRAGLIDVLVAADIRDDEIRKLYTDFLNDPDQRVRRSALIGLEQLVGPDDEQFLGPALKMLEDPDIGVRTQILSILADSKNFYALPAAIEALDQLLQHEDPHLRASGVRVLGEIAYILTSRTLQNVTRSIFSLTAHLKDPADQVRLSAVLAIEAVSENNLSEKTTELILQQMSSLVDDPVERIRQSTLVVYSRLGKEEAHPILLKALTDTSPQVRSVGVDKIVGIGKSIIPVVHPLLNSHEPQLRKMVSVILSRINSEEYSPLVTSYITGNLLDIYRNYNRLGALSNLVKFSAITVLQSALRERNRRLLDEIFYLLMAIHDQKTVKLISEALLSPESRTRANATEALESLTSPQTARLIGQIFDPEMSSTKLLTLGQEFWGMTPANSTEVIKQFTQDSENIWFRAIVTLALGELAVALAQQNNGSPLRTENTDMPQKPKRKRARGLDILGALADDRSGNDDREKETTGKKRRRQRSNPLDILAETNTDGNGQPVEPLPVSPLPISLTQLQIEELIKISFKDEMLEVRLAARTAMRMIQGADITTQVSKEEAILLSTVEKIIFLKEVPFFQGMTIDQLTVLANVCEEQLFEEDTRIYNQDDPGGTLYVVVNGRVGIEQEKRKGSFARLATIEAHSYFGEMNLFDNSPRTSAAIALQDTLTLKISREPLIALARQYPDLSLELINVLSQRLREANDRVADLTRTRPRELHKLFDKFD